MPKKVAVPHKASKPKSVAVSDTLIHLRDGDVVLYKRENSEKWQARYKLKNKWHRISTKERNADWAGKVACEVFDRARFLDDEDIVITSKKFGAVAKVVAKQLQDELDGGGGKVVYQT